MTRALYTHVYVHSSQKLQSFQKRNELLVTLNKHFCLLGYECVYVTGMSTGVEVAVLGTWINRQSRLETSKGSKTNNGGRDDIGKVDLDRRTSALATSGRGRGSRGATTSGAGTTASRGSGSAVQDGSQALDSVSSLSNLGGVAGRGGTRCAGRGSSTSGEGSGGPVADASLDSGVLDGG